MNIHIVMDNYATHKTLAIRLNIYVQQFARRPRRHIHFTPTSASWLHLVERFFAEFTDKQIKRGAHRSVHEFKTAIMSYIEKRNADPKPFKWVRTADQILAAVKQYCERLAPKPIIAQTPDQVSKYPPAKPYEIHTFPPACHSGICLTACGCDSVLGGGDGYRSGTVWRRAFGTSGHFFLERLVSHGGAGVSVRRLGGNRAGEMRIARFLHNRRVTRQEMLAQARTRTSRAAGGRHVLAIQDTTSLRVDEKGIGLSCHPVLAVDAHDGGVLGLVDAVFLDRRGGLKASRKARAFADKDSRRWLDGAESAATLSLAGAACVTVVEDREGDIYECFAHKPAGVEKLVRAGQDRLLIDGGSLYAHAGSLAEAGRMTVDLPAIPGRRARTGELSVAFAEVRIARPANRKAAQGLPEAVSVNLVVSREIDPPDGDEPAHWLLLTTHRVNDIADARRIIGFYRQRWTIEQLFRTMKTKGFCVEALRQEADGPLEKLVTAILIAAVKVMQLVAERDGKARRPLEDTLDPGDRPALERVCRNLEGKTEKQKNPHPEGSLAYAAWVFARLGGWTGYYGKPGPVVMLRGLTQFHAIKHGWTLRNV